MKSGEPVKHTCARIDGVITDLSDLESTISNSFTGMKIELEKLRNANDALRTWGNEEAERVDELGSENEELQSEIVNLKNDLAVSENKILEFQEA